MCKGFSVVVCTYNPDKTIFNRLLAALHNLIIPDNTAVEIIIVDNNSNPKLSSDKDLQVFISGDENRKCIVETAAGLTAARIRGYHEAKYEWLVYFDDDNEPNSEYLIELNKAIRQYPEVGCWGPAEIKVEFINTASTAWLQQQKALFQERNWGKTNFGTAAIWQFYFPYGTGLAVNAAIMQEYIKRINTGQYSLSDRKGKSLASGGDLQIVLTATNMKVPAGTVHGMCVNHLIAPKKSTIAYLVKQVYGTASSYIAAHKQVDSLLPIDDHLSSNKEIFNRLMLFFRSTLFKMNSKERKLKLADLMGGFNGPYIYHQKKDKPILIRLYEKLIHA